MTPNRRLSLLPALVSLLLIAGGASGQGEASSCPALIDTVLATAGARCRGTERNQICYGNDALQAEPAALLQNPGDIAPVAGLQSLHLTPINPQTGQWGVALARLQVNLPDTLPGENVTFLMYGDVVFEPLQQGAQSAVQAFRLATGIGGVRCGETEMNGLIVQTPETSAKVSFTLNGVEIRMGSTIQFTAQANGVMTVRALEGAAVVRAAGLGSAAAAGSQVTVPLDAALEPAAAPDFPVAYAREEVAALPVALLERSIEIADPLSDEALEALIALIESDDAGDFDLDDWLEGDDYQDFIDAYDDDSGDDSEPDDSDGGGELAGDVDSGGGDDSGGSGDDSGGGGDDSGGD
ncbi:MAG: hypothetical protein L6Q98_18500 [Anaerolineae bacterium]|nr:hypothetical protein [Anaerolineae bacterium]NUQ06837.1 hypothetical protein [Anaerolineae bacterium]